MIGKKLARFISGVLVAVLMMPSIVFGLDFNAINIVRVNAEIVTPVENDGVRFPVVTEVVEGSPAYISESMIYWEKYDNAEERWLPCYLSEFTSGKYRVSCQLRTDVATDRISDATELYVNGQKWNMEEGSFKDYYDEDGFGWVWYISDVYEVAADTNTHAILLADIKNGTVDLSAGSARKGDTISMTITPFEGYVVDTISVKDDNGDVTLSGTDLNKKFVVGDSDIKIDVKFKFVATTTYINQVEATGSIKAPTIGGEVVVPSFEVTAGLPACLPEQMIQWETLQNDEWVAYENGTFVAGKYRINCQLRTDGGNTYLLDPSVKLNINGKAWTVSDKYVVDPDSGYSWIWFSSEVFSIGVPLVVPTASPTTAPELSVGDFINRCYSVALGRSADEAGYNYWVDNLNNGQACGAQVGYGFIFSEEYINKNRTNEEFVNDMYAMYFGREADIDGFNYWVGLLESGLTREDIMAGFANSEEFNNLCNKYGVVCGTYLVGVPNDVQGGVNCFVARMYKVCLNRLPDMGGQAGWVLKLMSGEVSGTTCSYGFVFSPEFIGKNPSNEEFVAYMYRAFFGREADEAGFAAWVQTLIDGGSYEDVFNGFTGSAEFINLCASYGINA